MNVKNSIKNNPLKFGFMGASLDTGNMGVSALAASVIQLINYHYPKVKVHMFIGNRSNSPQIFNINNQKLMIPVINFRNSPKAHLSEQLWFIFLLALIYHFLPCSFIRKLILKSNHWLCELAAMDFVGEIRGGDSFSDIYGMIRFLLGSLPIIIAIWLNRPVILLPQTYGPYHNVITRIIARYILSHSKLILSRDKDSLPLVSHILKKKLAKPKILFCPDVAFMLETRPPANMYIYPPLPSLTGKILAGFNINGLMYNGGYTHRNMFDLKMDYSEFVNLMLEGLLAVKNVHILLIPHNFGTGNINSDPDACQHALQILSNGAQNNRIHLVMKSYNQSEIKGIIGKCNFFIGSRMHSCIAALSQDIPTVCVAYSKKFKGVFESVGAGQGVVDACAVTSEHAVKIILEQLQKKQILGKQSKKEMSNARKQINITFKSLIMISHE